MLETMIAAMVHYVPKWKDMIQTDSCLLSFVCNLKKIVQHVYNLLFNAPPCI